MPKTMHLADVEKQNKRWSYFMKTVAESCAAKKHLDAKICLLQAAKTGLSTQVSIKKNQKW